MDCGRLQYPTRNELQRAARVRCVDCGGTLEECNAARGKIADVHDARIEQKYINDKKRK